MSEWTDLQRAFVDEYLKDLNGAAAARRAGYSAENSRSQAAENLAKPHISEAIADRMEARAKRAGMSAKRVLASLVEKHEADLADIHDEEGRLLPIDEWPPAWRRGLVVGVETKELYEHELNKDTGKKERVFVGIERKLKIADRTKIAELIGRHVDVQAFRDKVTLEPGADMMKVLENLGGRSFRPMDDGRG